MFVSERNNRIHLCFNVYIDVNWIFNNCILTDCPYFIS